MINGNLPTEPPNGNKIALQPISPKCHWAVIIEIDSQGILASMTVQDDRFDVCRWYWNFIDETFVNCLDQLDLICGHPLFHIFQQIIPAHYTVGHYAVTVTAL